MVQLSKQIFFDRACGEIEESGYGVIKTIFLNVRQ
ncbi:MAG: hypothetical protein CM1200mP6_09560 [Anaerolineaceae bacterium]|nr:MAG: hypothetical protein CM1200mP6_09560 [Anaerolineaceae bacterium]